MSGLNHVYNITTQANSWIAIPSGYVYPMIDYGTHYDWSDWHITDFFPAITVKKYIDEIFAAAGYSYSSAFFDSDYFKKLIIPCSTRDFALNKADIDERIFEANTTEWDNGAVNLLVDETTPLLYLDPEEEKIIFTNEVADVGGVYNNTTGVFTATESGYYNFNVEIEINVEFAPTGAS